MSTQSDVPTATTTPNGQRQAEPTIVVCFHTIAVEVGRHSNSAGSDSDNGSDSENSSGSDNDGDITGVDFDAFMCAMLRAATARVETARVFYGAAEERDPEMPELVDDTRPRWQWERDQREWLAQRAALTDDRWSRVDYSNLFDDVGVSGRPDAARP